MLYNHLRDLLFYFLELYYDYYHFHFEYLYFHHLYLFLYLHYYYPYLYIYHLLDSIYIFYLLYLYSHFLRFQNQHIEIYLNHLLSNMYLINMHCLLLTMHLEMFYIQVILLGHSLFYL